MFSDVKTINLRCIRKWAYLSVNNTRNTVVILSHVLRENTAIYGHGGRMWQYSVVNESGCSTWCHGSTTLFSVSSRLSIRVAATSVCSRDVPVSVYWSLPSLTLAFTDPLTRLTLTSVGSLSYWHRSHWLHRFTDTDFTEVTVSLTLLPLREMTRQTFMTSFATNTRAEEKHDSTFTDVTVYKRILFCHPIKMSIAFLGFFP